MRTNKQTKTIKEPTTTLNTWLLHTPVKFAILTFISLVALGILLTIITNITSKTTGIVLTYISMTSLLCFSTYKLIQHLPNNRLDKFSFVSLYNIQTFFIAIFFFVTNLIIFMNTTELLSLLHDIAISPKWYHLIVFSLIAVVYLYMLGLIIANIYAKYLRCRYFNIPKWKIICSMPFGFSTLWTVGYLLPEQTNSNYALRVTNKYYSNITNSIIKSNMLNVISFFLLVLISSSLFGILSTTITILLTLLYFTFKYTFGPKYLQTHIKHWYSNLAVIINIALLLTVFLYIANKPASDVRINISDTTPISTNVTYNE